MNSSQPPASPDTHSAVVALAATVLPVWIRQLSTSRAQSEEAVAEMLSAFSDIGPALRSAAKTQKQDGQIQSAGEDAIERMFMGFQYQDRISQIMGLLLDDMQRMLAVLANPAQQSADVINQANWLERLESQYAMAEQRRDHSATASTHPVNGGTSGGSPEGDTDFF